MTLPLADDFYVDIKSSFIACIEMEAGAVNNLSLTAIMASPKITLNGPMKETQYLSDIMGPLHQNLDYTVMI